MMKGIGALLAVAMAAVTFVIGAFGRIEIWNAGRWNDQASLADDSLTQAVTSLGL